MNDEAVYRTAPATPGLLTRPGDLVMPDPFGCFLSQNLDYFRPYKNRVKPGYKYHPIEFMVIL